MLVLRFHRFTICNKICIPERGRAVALETSLPLSLSLSLSLTTHNYNKLTTAEIRCNSMSFPRCHRRVSFADYQIHTGIRSLSDRYWFVLRANFSSRFAACTRYFPTVHQISHGNSLELVCASSCQRITTRNSSLVNRFVRSFFFFLLFNSRNNGLFR